MSRFFIAILAMFAMFLTVQSVWAESTLSAKDQRLIQQIDERLNAQRTMQSRFVQLDGTGGFVEGTLYLKRPDQARFQYDPPSPLLLVATGNFLIEVDFELEQVTHYPQFDGVATYLLGNNLLQNPNLKIEEILDEDGVIRIRVTEREQPENGEITLVFDGATRFKTLDCDFA